MSPRSRTYIRSLPGANTCSWSAGYAVCRGGYWKRAWTRCCGCLRCGRIAIRRSPHTPKACGRRFCCLAALLHNPELLILDEPFSGLDVNTALVLRTLVRALAAEGKMIFYSSHVLEVVEKVCTSVLILRKGKVVAYDDVEHLRDLMQQPSLEGIFAQLTEAEDPGRVVGGILAAMRG